MKQYLDEFITQDDVQDLCEKLLNNELFIVVNARQTQFKVLYRSSSTKYVYNYTPKFVALRVFNKVRGAICITSAALNGYSPSSLKNHFTVFVCEALNEGLFTTTISPSEFRSKIDPQIIAF